MTGWVMAIISVVMVIFAGKVILALLNRPKMEQHYHAENPHPAPAPAPAPVVIIQVPAGSQITYPDEVQDSDLHAMIDGYYGDPGK